MKNINFLIMLIALNTAGNLNAQITEKFDIVSYKPPTGWTKDVGKGFIAYTIINNSNGEYARILLFESQQGTGNINADFDIEWKELVKQNYNPGDFTNTGISDYKDGWVSKLGVAPFQYENKNNAALLNTLVKGNTKISSVFITNTTTYQSVYEDFGSSFVFGNSGSAKNQSTQQIKTEVQVQNQTPVNELGNESQPNTSGFTFTTSNFDDGWTSTVQKDYVLVEKGNSRVYLYFTVPYNSDNFSGTGVMDRDYYWDNYVAPQFRTTSKQYSDGAEFISSLMPKYVEGLGIDPISGQQVFVAMTLSVSPNAAQLTVASYPDEVSFRQAFPNANGQFTSDLTNMSRYNKFAVAARDIIGRWESGSTATAQWYYESPSGYQGYAGMTVAARSAVFNFNSNGTYTSTHNGATGSVGNMATYQQDYKGTYTVSNWNVVATNRWQGQTDNFDASFEVVRGGRILRLGALYTLVKVK